MLRLLSWSACDRFPTSDMLTFLSRQESPSRTTQPSMLTKRKRDCIDEDVMSQPSCLSNMSDRQNRSTELPPGTINTAVSSAANLTEGLPTPLLSPHENKMECSNLIAKDDDASAQQRTEARERSLRQTIQTQLSLEILLKHKELRLIDQELAKCQVALEQLRRCSEIPYPVNQLSYDVSAGQGPALRPSFSGKLPVSPAAWGVTDGPYTRHYAKWLLEDVQFDGGNPELPMICLPDQTPILGRTRGSFVDHNQVGMKSRSQRSGKLKSLPAGYGQPKEKATGPMILKRKSDGVMVKLVCPDCGRHDFGSAQGFINHCRIGHGRNFASHDAAAEACGEPVEYDESGAVIGAEPAVTPSTSSVHPLIRSAKLLPSTPTSFVAKPLDNSQSNTIGRTKFQHVTSPDFRASSMTPHLSALVQNRGLGLDLQEMVVDAKTKVELPESDDDESEEENEVPTADTTRGRHPQVAGTKQLSKPSKSPATSPLLSIRPTLQTNVVVANLDQRRVNSSQITPLSRNIVPTHLQSLDPSPATESNQAPSLIDDDEEFEAHSPTSTSISEDAEEGDVEFAVQDEDDVQQPVLPRPDIQFSCTQSTTRPTSSRIRRPSALRRSIEGREEKHVSFVRSSPTTELQQTSPAGDRKRRKISKS